MTKLEQDGDGGSIYSLKAVLNKNPVDIQTAIMAGITVIVCAGWWSPSAKLLTAISTFVVVILSLFIKAKTANRAVLHEVQNAVDSAKGAA